MYVRVAGVSIHSGLKPILYMLLMMLSTLTVILKYKLFNLKKGDRLIKTTQYIQLSLLMLLLFILFIFSAYGISSQAKSESFERFKK